MLAAVPVSGQTPDQLQKAADRCNSPLGSMIPECQTLKSAMPAAPALPRTSGALSLGDQSATVKESREPKEQPAAPPALVPGADAPSEFQRFAAMSVGSILPVFGASLFEKVPTTFAPLERVPVTADYVVGPGDEIVLRVWGQVNLNLELQADRAGAVFIPQVGNVTVSGLQFKQLPAFLKSELGRVFRNFDLSVSMGQLRSIQIFVMGQARRPGTYTVSSLSTLVNVLFASGGPTSQGSMRHIQLKRGGATVSEIDIYDLLLRGDKSKDVRLLPGDMVYIPTAGPQVAIAGSIRNPAVFELKDERTVDDLIQTAGGLASTADLKHLVLERINAGRQREVLDLSLNAVGRAVAVREADILRIQSISPRFDRAVTLRGNVANPGRFAWHEGMRLRDIIPDKESLVTRAYWTQRNKLGVVPPDEKEAPRAVAGVGPLESLPETKHNRLTSASAQETEISQAAAAADLAGSVPEINWSYAVIERQDPDKLTTQLVPFNLGKLILQNDATQNLELRSGDVVTIFSTSDIRVPMAQQNRYVRLEGEFNAAGVYLVRPGETLGQLIERSGGLTPQAYLFGSAFTRESTRQDQQGRLDQFLQEMEKELAQSSSARASAAATSEETQATNAQLSAEHRILDQMRSLKPTGRIVLNLDPHDNGLGKLMDLTLEDGDRFFVPVTTATVNVFGAVYNQNAFLHDPKLRVEDYLSEAGGFTRNADKKRVLIIRADGSVVPKRSAGPFTKTFEAARLNPGDSIAVPTEMFKVPFMRGLRDWTQVFSQLALGAAAINVLK
jgi:protein involved in polysaccharide export with SLBB domain